MDCLLHVGNFLIYDWWKYVRSIERKLQLCHNRILILTEELGFVISKTKTKYVYFWNLCKMYNVPSLELANNEIHITE